MNKPLALAALCLLLGACASVPPPPAPQPQPIPAASAAPVPIAVAVTRHDYASDSLLATAWTQRAVEHDLVYTEIYRAAQAQLLTALNTPTWDALPKAAREGPATGLTPAVVLDIDETVLDNSPYQARLIKSGREYDDATWADWVRQASAEPLPGALEYTRFAAAHGITVLYVSNRVAELTAPTVANLRSAGFPLADDSVVYSLGMKVPGCTQTGSSKACRRRMIAKEYRVLEQVGDQVGDFIQPAANTPAGRAAAMKPYADWIGERWFVLPNPTYGSWQPALFGNDWSLSPAERHAREVEALRTQ
ncbi:MAG TPA: HAD family acid phosphatase [Rhodanobacteraceae bacterium]|nr:HAD family acid phosphatase [Rhodanobacteraceae bacterium]